MTGHITEEAPKSQHLNDDRRLDRRHGRMSIREVQEIIWNICVPNKKITRVVRGEMDSGVSQRELSRDFARVSERSG